MTLNPKLTKLLNEQINNEMSSSYVYLAMAAWFEQTPYAALPSGCSPRAARRPCMR
jgi:ferritin